MSLPDILQPHLDGEQIAARVSLGGEDELFVTPTRTLIYRADGLLSDESVDEYPHDAERVSLKEGRRKTKIELDYGIDGDRAFTVPTKRADEVLHPVLAGVLNGAGVTEPGETIEETYRFSELTLVITSARIVKHIGTAVWDREYEEYHYDDVRDIEVEEGSVSSQIVIDVAGRPQRVKAQNDVSREIFERLKRALLAYRDVATYAEFEALFAEDEAEEPREPTPSVEFDDAPADHWADSEGVEPIEVNLPDEEEGEADPLAADAPAPDTEPAASAEPAEPAGRAGSAGSATAETRSAGATGAATDRRPATAPEPAPEPAPRTEPEREAEPAATAERAPATPEPASAAEPAGTPEPERESTGEPADAGFAGSEFQTATSNLRDEREETLAELARAVEKQGELLAEQQRVIEELVAELDLSRDR